MSPTFFFPQHGKIFNACRCAPHSPSHLPKHRAGENFRPARFESCQSSSPLDMISEEASGPCAQGQEPPVVPSPEAVCPNGAGPWKPCRGLWHRLGHCQGSRYSTQAEKLLQPVPASAWQATCPLDAAAASSPHRPAEAPHRPPLATAVGTTSSLRAWSPDGTSATRLSNISGWALPVSVPCDLSPAHLPTCPPSL